jgi:diguanylate cyclase (GGDEF)-like protein
MSVGVLICAGYLFLPAGSVPASIVYNSAGLLCVLVLLAGVRRNRPADTTACHLFAAGVTTLVAADVIYEVSGHVLGHHPYPYWDDVLYFASYPLLWTGLLRLTRGRGRQDVPGMIDAAVTAVGVGLVYWVLLIDPILSEAATPLIERLVSVGYPTCDVLMCAVITRLLAGPGRRTPSVALFAAGTVLTLACDIAWTLTGSLATYNEGLINTGFLLAYVLWAGAVLHPSVAAATPAIPVAGTVGFRRGRLALLATCTLLVPAVLLVQGVRGDPINWLAIGIGAVILFVLVLARLSGFVRQVQTQAAQLEALAMLDDLTGLANRRRFELRLTEVMAAEILAAGPAQIFLLDLNGFKAVNDRFGHGVGDRLLAAVAERLRGELRDADLVARMGGDEFAVLLLGATAGEGDAVVARLSAVLRAAVDVNGHELLVAASIGVADTTGTGDPVELLRRADVAMYAAKASGARFRRYAPELDDRAGEEARLGAELRAALDTGQFHLVYQPIVALPGGEVRSVESLIRWQHPQRGFVSPVAFIPVAERNGLIVELGEWILRTACTQFVRWHVADPAVAPSRISVNVSARQLAEPGFPEVVADALAEAGMQPGQLIVEVTETAVFGGGVAVQAVRDLHELGVRIALDDFGTGHSSLGLLQTVPVDVLKVDKSFVDNLTMAGRHAVIATALIQVANGLGLDAVAEGVETAEQAAELHRLGYQLAQGYHFGRPVAEPDFRAMAVVVS